jgi:four helix bundle protein
MKKPSSTFDLEERTAVFGEAIIEFCLTLPFNPVNSPVISQLVAACTSVGANYCEADEAESKKDFRHKIAICRKEAKESKYWLRMVAKAVPAQKSQARKLWIEAKELHLIFCAIIRTTDQNLRQVQLGAKPIQAKSHESLGLGH